MSKQTSLMCALAAAIVVMSGCTPAVYTVGGTIPSSNSSKGATKAQFSLQGDSCDGLEVGPKGSFTYHDKSAIAYNPNLKGNGLQMTGPVLLVSDCSNPGSVEEDAFCHGVWQGESNPEIEYLLQNCPLLGGASNAPVKFFAGWYTSTNTRYPGDGLVLGCVQDNGQGRKATFKDQAVILVPGDAYTFGGNGPYQGYINQGSVQGNVSTYTCPPPP